MADGTRISKSPTVFNSYINATNAYLLDGTPTTNGVRLGLTPTQITDWGTKCVYWRDTLYPKYSTKALQTEAVVEEVHNFIRDFKVFANPLLDSMAANAAAVEMDEKTFRFVKRENRKKPSRKTEPITELCYGTMEAIGGGVVKNGCRSSHDAKRPSLAEGANGVEVSYFLADVKAGDTSATPATPSASTTEKDDKGIPAANDPRMTHLVFSKAKFILECGPENSGKTLAIYHRWINTKYPKLAGQWSSIQIQLLL